MVAEAVLLLQRVAIVTILVNWMVSTSVGEDRPRLPVDRMPPHLLVDKMPLGLNKVRHVPEDNALFSGSATCSTNTIRTPPRRG